MVPRDFRKAQNRAPIISNGVRFLDAGRKISILVESCDVALCLEYCRCVCRDEKYIKTYDAVKLNVFFLFFWHCFACKFGCFSYGVFFYCFFYTV